MPADRILELGSDDNFWQMGDTGPCGRCSEIYYVRGTGADPEIEVWNNVFMEFDRSADGTLTPLPAPSIDTGMGLERVTAVLQGKDSNYDTDLFMPLLRRIGELTGSAYGTDATRDISMRVVADHIRATTFLIGDGVIPSNEWRGYVLRKIMRRAMRHGRMHLGFHEPFLHKLVGVLVQEMGDAYPELPANRFIIETTILAEEVRFGAVLTDGLPRLEAEIAKALETAARTLPGAVAFQLYDTFGVPYDFIEDTAATHGVGVDKAGYELAMEAQRGKGRSQSAFGGGKKGEEFAVVDEAALRRVGDQFDGYTSLRRHRRAGRGALRRVAQAGERLAGRRRGLRGARADAVLPRVRRPGVRLRAHSERRDRRQRVRGRRRAHPSRIAARAQDPRRGRVDQSARDRHRRSRCGRPQRHAEETTRPRICCTPRCARCSART